MDGHMHRPGLQTHAAALPLPIRRSWERCTAWAGSLGAEPVTLLRGDLDDRRAQHADMLRAAQPEVDTLANMVASAASMVVLADATGVILQATGNTDFLQRADRVALRPGVSWAENHRGTNAVGTALAEAMPLRVHGAEHFLSSNQILSCHASPIRSPRGDVLGALDISSDANRLHAYALGLATLFSRQISNRLIEQAAPLTQYIVLHAHPSSLDAVERGLLQIDGERIVGANDAALTLLHTDWASVLDRPVADWLPTWRSLGLEPRPIQARTGLRLHALLHRPDASRVAVPTAIPKPPETLPPPAARAPAILPDRTLPPLAEALQPGFEQAIRALDGGLSVLLQGETGTGKEVYARHLHRQSRWRDGPFVAINCGALPETLVEAELFGYEAGAYTGARRNGFLGRLREADGGILFLDEIGDMPPALQTRLLRVLQDRIVQPLGSMRAVPVDFGVLSATNRPLPALMSEGRFRPDLYYRLQDFGIDLPPLRERTDLRRFVCASLRACAPSGGPVLSDEALARLAAYAWPGNYRQLHAVLRGLALVHRAGSSIRAENLPAEIRQENRGTGPLPSVAARRNEAYRPLNTGVSAPSTGHEALTTLRDIQQQRIAEVLALHDGNVSQTARTLGIHRSTLHRYLAADSRSARSKAEGKPT